MVEVLVSSEAVKSHYVFNDHEASGRLSEERFS